MYSIYNVQSFLSARVDETEGTISLKLHGQDNLFVINKDDELYEYHLKNLQVSKDQIIEAYGDKKEEPENPLKD